MGLGDKSVLGTIAAVITIFVFITGIGSLTILFNISSQRQRQKTSSEQPQAVSSEKHHSIVKPQRTAPQPKRGDTIRNSLGMKLIYIPPGEFLMGSPASEDDRRSYSKPQHRVKISRGFYMGVTEVTQAQWRAIMKTTVGQQRDKIDSIFSLVGEGSNHPVYFVSWDEATEFCRKLSRQEGENYRLPTEAEWEYACRAGSTTSFCFGDSDLELSDYAWYGHNSNRQTHTVGHKKPNAFGLHDMHGNVDEWCADRYSDNYFSISPSVDPGGPSTGEDRVVRGGSWIINPVGLSLSADRGPYRPDGRGNAIGFRIVLEMKI